VQTGEPRRKQDGRKTPDEAKTKPCHISAVHEGFFSKRGQVSRPKRGGGNGKAEEEVKQQKKKTTPPKKEKTTTNEKEEEERVQIFSKRDHWLKNVGHLMGKKAKGGVW